MRDRDIERMFGRVGDAARPDVDFEEDLLLRLDAVLRDELIVHEPADISPPFKPVDIAVDLDPDNPTDPDAASRTWISWLPAVAASVLAVVGVVGLLVAVRSPQSDAPAQSTPTPTFAVASDPMQQVLGTVCARHAGELADIDALESPINAQFIAGEGSMLLTRLAEITNDYAAAVDLVAPQVDQSVADELTALVRDLDNEIAFFDRDRTDSARYTIPVLADRLLAINAALSSSGVTACG